LVSLVTASPTSLAYPPSLHDALPISTVRPTPWLEARRAGRSWQTVVVHLACVASVVKNRVSLPETVWLMNQILVATTHHLGAGPYRPQIGKLLLHIHHLTGVHTGFPARPIAARKHPTWPHGKTPYREPVDETPNTGHVITPVGSSRQTVPHHLEYRRLHRRSRQRQLAPALVQQPAH